MCWSSSHVKYKQLGQWCKEFTTMASIRSVKSENYRKKDHGTKKGRGYIHKLFINLSGRKSGIPPKRANESKDREALERMKICLGPHGIPTKAWDFWVIVYYSSLNWLTKACRVWKYD